jgi:predicted phosphate transport protein (TIGR00153 family)
MGFKFPRLIPKEEHFYDMFDQLAVIAVRTAEELTVLVKDPPNATAVARRMKTLEHEADEITRGIIDRLNRSFVTPIDRGDIHALACGLDEIIDYTEVAGHKISLYELPAFQQEVVTVAELLLAATQAVEKAVRGLRKFPDAQAHIREINALEGEADAVCRVALANLLNKEKDAIVIIKWKEIYEILEGATDRCEDVADIVDGVIVKNA